MLLSDECLDVYEAQENMCCLAVTPTPECFGTVAPFDSQVKLPQKKTANRYIGNELMS